MTTTAAPHTSLQLTPRGLRRLTTTFAPSVASSTWQPAPLQTNHRGGEGSSSSSSQSSRSNYSGDGNPPDSLIPSRSSSGSSSSNSSSPRYDLVPDYVRSFLLQQEQKKQQTEHPWQGNCGSTTTTSPATNNAPAGNTSLDPIDEAISEWTRATTTNPRRPQRVLTPAALGPSSEPPSGEFVAAIPSRDGSRALGTQQRRWSRAGEIQGLRHGSGSSGNGLGRVEEQEEEGLGQIGRDVGMGAYQRVEGFGSPLERGDPQEGRSSGGRRGQWGEEEEEEERRFLWGAEQEDFSPADEKGVASRDDDGRARGCVGVLVGGGWRFGMALIVSAMLMVLAAAFACLVAAISELVEGRTAVFSGGCDKARRIDWALHAVVSVLGVALLAGAHYAFQVLTSPTRDEVSSAHHRHVWLDVGVPSFRNLRHIETRRAVLAVVVLASAVCVQAMYNAVIYVSQTAPAWKVARVSESFTKGADFTVVSSNDARLLTRTELLSLQQQAVRNELLRLAPSACASHFRHGEYQQDYSAVLVVTAPQDDGVQPLYRDAIAGLTIDPNTTIVRHCLALPAPAPTCEIHLNAALLGTVALLNSITVTAIAAVLFKRTSSFRPLATLGDAIASLLEAPDPTTQGACLLSKADVRRGCWPPFTAQARYWVPYEHFWFRSVSAPRWAASAPIWLVAAGLAAGGLALAIVRAPDGRFSPPGVAGAVPRALLQLPTDTPPAAAAVLASLPQLLLALLYLAANALLSAYWVSHESSLFAVGGPRPLRVSSANPFGLQRRSARLSLPWPVSGLMGVLFAGMAFTLSQGVVAVAARRVGVTIANPSSFSPSAVGHQDEDAVLIAVGLNSAALLALLSALGLLAAVVVGLGFMKAPRMGREPGNPMALAGGSCSAVISARCHLLARERSLLLWGERIMWGVVRDGEGDGEGDGRATVSHCGFTSGRPGEVEAGRTYA
ncbi:hypothetical protein VTJ83DRAFT_7316 [Remersonia thermophila]|uniref:DUF6536 domain-containing protein n=1 Tax=Remersonia thermophila TaxID=72144 RepID=A0ABR4D370_9PEZI